MGDEDRALDVGASHLNEGVPLGGELHPFGRGVEMEGGGQLHDGVDETPALIVGDQVVDEPLATRPANSQPEQAEVTPEDVKERRRSRPRSDIAAKWPGLVDEFTAWPGIPIPAADSTIDGGTGPSGPRRCRRMGTTSSTPIRTRGSGRTNRPFPVPTMRSGDVPVVNSPQVGPLGACLGSLMEQADGGDRPSTHRTTSQSNDRYRAACAPGVRPLKRRPSTHNDGRRPDAHVAAPLLPPGS